MVGVEPAEHGSGGGHDDLAIAGVQPDMGIRVLVTVAMPVVVFFRVLEQKHVRQVHEFDHDSLAGEIFDRCLEPRFQCLSHPEHNIRFGQGARLRGPEVVVVVGCIGRNDELGHPDAFHDPRNERLNGRYVSHDLRLVRS